ncbi:MAG TPA: ABC transporter permease [bacterium]|nr:ABC transporter permease [bacterium]HQJ64356.1 ABC transporter permease [bacterium]HQJ65468.1 ABC transporter permease [bacterium]
MAKILSDKFFEQLGERTISFFTTVYDIAVLFIQSIKALPSLWFYRRQFLEQIYAFSVKTLPIAAVIAVFIGLGATVQSTYQSSELLTRAILVNVIFKTTILELCPIILSLVLAGKLGASLAAEIGSMKISEQIEALETMSLDPVGFLVVPRIVAGLLMLPVITIFANALAIFSSFFVSAVATDWISAQEFGSGMQMDFKAFELYFGNLIKPAVYGVLIALVGSYFGLRTTGGAKGVGTASTNAVVVSAVFIVIFDYYLGKLLL